MIDFRPHTLRVVSFIKGETADNGDYSGDKPNLSDQIPCRYELSNKANTIALPDGKAFAYSLIVYLDLSDVDYPYGTTIQLFDKNGNKAFEKQIQGFHRGQLNMKLWV